MRIFANRAGVLGLLVVCLGLVSAAPAVAAATATTPAALPLANFMTANQPIRLRYTSDEFILYIPVSPRLRIKSALLHLQLTNSISLLRERSQLAVRLNGKVLAQVPLNPAQPEASADIRLPGVLLKPGYNQLTFDVAQHYTLQCEDPSAPELWTEIDSVNSTIAFDSALPALQPRLSDMTQLFDPKTPGDRSLTIIIAGAAPVRDDQLQWGMLVAQGAALRLQYVPLQISHATAVPAGARLGANASFPGLKQDGFIDTDSALIGTKAELAPYLAKSILDGITGSFLGVYPLDADPRRFVLVVSGGNAAEVAQAARAFAFMDFPYPDTASTQVTTLDIPAIADYAGRNVLAHDGLYHFSQLAFDTTTVRGTAASSLINEDHVQNLEFEIVMPPDLFAHEDKNVDLLLHFSYGAGLRKDSVLNIMLNERFERAIALDQPGGAVYQKYQIAIPLRSFQPGVNKIRFAPRMMPSITGQCQAIQTENLQLTLYQDSALKMPSSAHFATMPDLRLTARAGFPYTIKADGSGTAVEVVSNDSPTIGAAWMLVGKLAQRSGHLLHQIAISFAKPAAPDRDLIVVGVTAQVDPSILQGAPVQLGRMSKIPYPEAAENPAQNAPTDWLGRILPGNSSTLEIGDEAHAADNPVLMTEAAGLTSHALAVQYRVPGSKGRTATAVMAATPELLHDSVAELIKPEIWNGLRGSVVIWNKGADSVAWQSSGSGYTVGDVSTESRMEFYFSRYPWAWFVVVLLLLLPLAWLTVRMLGSYRRKYHPRAPDRRDRA
jgi:cellulose synthase operon protein B